MVFELYGCPGCGKSTVVRKTEQILKEAGIKCLNYYDVFFDGDSSAKHRLLCYFKAIFDPSSGSLNFHIIKTSVELKCPFKYAIYLMTMCRKIRNENSTSEDTIILLDEGVIQFVTSLSHGKNISSYESVGSLIQQIKHSGITVKAIECILPINENVKRLIGREQSSRFLEAKDEDELQKLLAGKKKNLDFVSSFFETPISLDMSEEPEKNAGRLSELILTSCKNA